MVRPRSSGCSILARSCGDGGTGRRSRIGVAEQPPHVCVNEILISPTWNRIYLGGPDIQRR
jgi:hypothetical protein